MCTDSKWRRDLRQQSIADLYSIYRDTGWRRTPSYEAIARAFKTSATSVKRALAKCGIDTGPPGRPRSGINWDTIELGEQTDLSIATHLGVSEETVRRARKERGIEPYGYHQLPDGVSWDELPLGEVPDKVLADKYGVGQGTVSRRRRERGIPAFKTKYRSRFRKTVKKPEDPKVDAKMAELFFEDGIELKYIAERFDTSPAQVSKRLRRRYRIERLERHMRGMGKAPEPPHQSAP